MMTWLAQLSLCGMLVVAPAASILADPSTEALPRPDHAGLLCEATDFRFEERSFDEDTEIALFIYCASWCPSCRGVADRLKEIYPELQKDDAGLTIVTVSIEDSAPQRARHLRGCGYPWLALHPKALEDRNWRFDLSGGVPQLQAFRILEDTLEPLGPPGAPGDVLKLALAELASASDHQAERGD